MRAERCARSLVLWMKHSWNTWSCSVWTSPQGYLLLEEVADDRTYTTWKTLVEERLKGLGTGVLYVVSDRAKALIQLAEQGLECLSMPDFFHVAREIVQSYSLAIGQRWRHAQQELTKAKEALVRRQGLHHTEQATREARALVEARQASVTRWEEVYHLYRGHAKASRSRPSVSRARCPRPPPRSQANSRQR